MSDELKTNDTGATASQEQQSQATAKETTEQQQTVDVNEVSKMLEKMKKLSSNFDRVNTEKVKLEQELKKEKEKSLTSKQIEEMKQQEYDNELKKRETELKHQTLLFEKTKYLNEKKLDAEYLDIISGEDIETYQENVEKLNKIIQKHIQKEKDALLMQSNPLPGSGKSGNPDIFTLEEIKQNCAKNGVRWATENYEKIQKSYEYWDRNK